MKVIEVGEISLIEEELIRAADSKYHFIRLNIEDIQNNPLLLKNSKLLFVIHLKSFGVNPDIDILTGILAAHYEKNQTIFQNSLGAILISSEGEDYTKQTASIFEYRLNNMGLRFVGRPIIEAPDKLQNFIGHAERSGKSLEENLFSEFQKMLHSMDKLYSVLETQQNRKENYIGESIEKGDLGEENSISNKCKKIVVLHSSNEDSNTLELWKMIRKYLSFFKIKEIHLENGEILDCKACSYRVCKHFAKQTSCYYGGAIVEDVYPAILESDIVILLCPNYNDALSANISAMINRLTALFRKQKFYDKKIYAVIVSGSSGTEAVATQIIRALNMNKTFHLPPYFSISAIANNKGAIHKVEGIEEKAKNFAIKLIHDNL